MKHPLVRVARHLMATRFEIALHGRDRHYLQSAGETVLDEIARIEAQLSFYRSDSDIAEINRSAHLEPVPVDGVLFALLSRAKHLGQATQGAFDITIGPLLQAWGMTGEGGSIPDPVKAAAEKQNCGWHNLLLDADTQTVAFARPGMSINLGAVGKGFAVARGTEILQELEVPGALLHGGTSSIAAVGKDPQGGSWQVSLRNPYDDTAPLSTLQLCSNTLSTSGVHNRYFTAGERRLAHILDPRTGEPVESAVISAVVCGDAADGDALSTALLVLGEEGLPLVRSLGADWAMVALPVEGGLEVLTSGHLPGIPSI